MRGSSVFASASRTSWLGRATGPGPARGGSGAGQRRRFAEAKRQLGAVEVGEADDCWVVQRGRHEVRRYLLFAEGLAGWLDWQHLETVVRVHKVVRDELGEVASDNEDDGRYYVTSLRSLALQPRQLSDMNRRRWAADSQCHHTWDTVFEEDDHPSITSDPCGAVVARVLRRIAYNLMAFYRSVTLRSTCLRRLSRSLRSRLTRPDAPTRTGPCRGAGSSAG